jgi:3-oxoacyl-[acyl-carrier-protein] synthase II
MQKRRVVITGLGMVTPVGHGVEDTWTAILQGKSGVGLITRLDATPFASHIAAEVKGFDIEQYLAAKDARKIDDFIQLGYAASVQALTDSGLTITEENSTRIGVAIGSGIGGLPEIERTYLTFLSGGARKISPFFIPGAIINMASGFVSIQHGLRGPNISIVTACTTGTHNIGYAARTIAYGDADAMLAGGTEMATCKLGVGGFSALRALSTRNDDPERASRPWDRDRDGFVLAEGAGVLMLEEYEHAKARGARIYAELAGFGMSADAFHITKPGGDGAFLSMINGLRDAGLNKEEINYINAHGTSTPAGDLAEVDAIKKTFGDDAYKIPISSTKSMIGHLLGAAGAVEAIFCVLAIRDQVAPPTINLDNPGEGCDLDFIPHIARKMRVKVALSNSFGFGGTNGSLLFKEI